MPNVGCLNNCNVKMQSYIVTGATGAIGSAIVEELISRGVDVVILACRNVKRAEGLIESLHKLFPDSKTILKTLELDLESFDSVRVGAMEFLAMGYELKALLNNAGTMPGEIKVTKDGYESATQTNFMSTIMFTRLLLPAMSKGSSIVFTTSMTRKIVRLRADWAQHAISHKGLFRRFTTYGRSKLMLAQYARRLSQELAGHGIMVNCSDPGIVDSGIISMGNRVVDWLSDRLFRPIINTPKEGAFPAIKAMDSLGTGQIFTRRHVYVIPHKDFNPSILDFQHSHLCDEVAQGC